MNLMRSLLRLVFGRRLPTVSGDLNLAGISRPVVIRRDCFGIPYVEAENDADAWYGLGFCQGQDRGFQLEMLLRATRGMLAELIGQAGLPMDRLSRRIGFHRAAQGHVAALDAQTLCMVNAFAQGVSAGASVGCRKPAHEFALLRARPTPFEAVDVLAGLNYIAFGLSTWTAKLTRLILLQEDGPEALKALDGAYAEWLPLTRPVGALAGPALDRLGQDLAQLVDVLGSGGASNNWALNSSRTATGRPILANDPHLAPTIPPPWYLVHIQTPAWAVSGASFVGAPMIAAGHNQVAAWGVTAGLADNVDLYLEELGDAGRTVREGEQFVPCEIRRETINVKGQAPVEEEVVITPRGPIISPVLDGEVGALAMRATWMSPKSLQGLTQIYHVESFAAFRHALERFPLSSLNMVYADASDTIGWQLVGELPQRGQAWGVTPLPGWERDLQWLPDPIPYDDMPFLSQPETGFVATANNKPTSDDDGPYLGNHWTDGYRHARIVEVLASRSDWNLSSTLALQMDQLSVPWREMRSIVLAAPAPTARVREALDLLGAWDGVIAQDAPAAALYEFFLAEMLYKVTTAQAPNAVAWAMGQGFHPMLPRSFFGVSISHLVQLLREQPGGWFQRAWDVEIADALERAMRKLQEKFGPSPTRWAWGDVRPLTLLHPLGAVRPLDRIFNQGPFPWGGDAQTVSQAGRMLTDLQANPPVIANLRMVIDVGQWEQSRFVLAGGQSGNPLSPHYADLLAHWKRGEGVPIAWSQQAIEQAARSTLKLNPLKTA